MISQIDAGGIETGHAGEVDGGLGLAGADEDAALAGAQREDVAGTGEVTGCGVGIDGGADGVGAVGGGDAGGDAFAGLDGLGECGAEARGVLLGHGEEAQVVGALLGQGEADEAAAVAGHEVDGLGGDVLGGEGEVAFVFAVFVVDDDHHAAGADVGDGAGNVGEGRLEGACGIGHRSALILNDGGADGKAWTQGKNAGHKAKAPLDSGAFSDGLLMKVYNVDSISKPQASRRASGIYFEFLFRRAHSRSRVDRMY